MRPALVNYFKRKTGSAVEAEDLAQETVVRALTHVDLKSPEQAKAYIFRTAVNLWRDRGRRQRVQGMIVEWNETAAAEVGAVNPPERVLIGQEELTRVVRVLRELDPRARTVLMLVRLEQMKIANVALALGVSVRTIAKDLARAVARLARMRDSEEFDDES
jgi:RNA polymerase sigma factor (sigma-70 family)